jgi:glycosyltransferase involved in cell wall biosynthesis
MELFARDLSQALVAHEGVDLKVVKWGGSGRVKAVLIALPYLFIRALGALCRRRVDIIHVQDGLLAPAGYILSRLFRKPFVVVIHGLDITYRNRLFRFVVPWTVRRADRVICISQAAADEAAQRGVPTDRLQVIPLAVNDELHGTTSRADLLDALNLPTDSKLLLTVGRLVERKGVAWFIEQVLPELVEHYPQLIYLVAGEGQARPAIEAAIKRTNLGTHVRLLSTITDELYQAVYNGADVFVMPNIAVPGDVEGFGLVLLEASLCALPVVAADTEGISDTVIDGQNGILVPSGDGAAFQREVGRLLHDAAAARRFGQQSRYFTLKHYQWGMLVEQYIQQYKNIIQ